MSRTIYAFSEKLGNLIVNQSKKFLEITFKAFKLGREYLLHNNKRLGRQHDGLLYKATNADF